MRTFVILIAFILYHFSYPLCELIAPTNIEFWWKAKYTLFSSVIISLVLANKIEDYSIKWNNYSKFILNVFIGSILSDIIDRTFFSIEFNIYDYLMLGLNILINILIDSTIRKKIAKHLINLVTPRNHNTS